MMVDEGVTHVSGCECYTCDSINRWHYFGSLHPEWLQEEEDEYYQATEGMTDDEIRNWLDNKEQESENR